MITAGEETGCEGALDLAGRKDRLGKAGAIVVAEPTGNRPLSVTRARYGSQRRRGA